METVNILGINFSNVKVDEAVKIAINCIENNEKGYIVTPNSEIAYMTLEDKKLLDIINNAKLVLPDGIGIIHAGKILKTPLKEKVAGVVFSEKLVEQMAKKSMSLYILGAKPSIAKKACENLAKKYEGLKIAGYMDGYFKDEQEAFCDIQKQKVDVLFVCLGAPKQEKFIYDNLDKLDATIICGIGGSADVFSGEVNRAPDIFVKLGLEWFYRLLKQPSRIGRMMRLPLFLIEIFKDKKRK